jgi:hypothetical protein
LARNSVTLRAWCGVLKTGSIETLKKEVRN